MPIKQPIQVQASTFEVVPEDMYNVTVKDVEMVDSTNWNTGQPEQKLQFTFEIADGEHKGALLSRRTTFNYSSKSVLFNLVSSVAGKAVPAEQVTMDFINSMIGSPVRVVVKNTVKDNNEYSNIESFMKPSTATPQQTQTTPTAQAEEVAQQAEESATDNPYPPVA